jgi:uncharacterized protein (DUF2062 family)
MRPFSFQHAAGKLRPFLVQGISPRRLAFTLSVGFVLGCIPVVGIPTCLCVVVALLLRLNQPAIQAANYAAMPFQVALIVPFARLGGKLTSRAMQPSLDLSGLTSVLTHSPLQAVMHCSGTFLGQLSLLAAQALLAWLVVAVPVAVVMTLMLTGVLRRVPALTPSSAAD